MECCWGLATGFGLFIVGLVIHGIVLQKAKTAYLEVLEQLKADPHNPELREEALRRGRRYFSFAKHSPFKENRSFDEPALLNDINAACARAGTGAVRDPGPSAPTIEKRLAKLDALRKSGAISEAEHQARRQRILDEL
jgi:hypothetical protein